MQWNRVKSILIVLLLLVNVFLALNTAFRYFYERSSRLEVRRNVISVLAEKNISCGDKVLTKKTQRPVIYETERDRKKEIEFSNALLSGSITEKEFEDGSSCFQSGEEEIYWRSNGDIDGTLKMKSGAFPKNNVEAVEMVRQLLSRAGIFVSDKRIVINNRLGNYEAEISCEINNISVFNCGLSVILKPDEVIKISGRWNFGMIYEVEPENERFSSEEDAILSFIKQAEDIKQINEVSVSYFLTDITGGKYRFIPAWSISTDLGEYCIDASKKTILKEPNNV